MRKISEGLRHHQQAKIETRHYSYSLSGEPQTGIIRSLAEKHHSHSPTEEPRPGIINRLELQQGTTTTHRLESQGQASSTG
jgi:hypothetical protein